MKRTKSHFVLLAVTTVALITATASADSLAGPRERGQAKASVNRPGPAGGNKVNRSSNRTTVNSNRNVNVNSNRDVNIDVDNHGGRYDDHYHPIATAAAVTATVAVTSAVIGSVVRANQLPPSCVQIMRGNAAYMQCGTVWYQPQYQGSNVTYIVVNQP